MHAAQPDWKSQDFSDFVLKICAKKYAVGLHIVFVQNNERKHSVYSGFIATLLGRGVWITAGHNIDQLAEIATDCSVKIESVQFVDGFKNAEAAFIPFAIDRCKMFSATNRGLDFGAIALSYYYTANLQANEGLRFLRLDLDELPDIESPDGYYIVGAPAETLVVEDTSDGHAFDCSARLFAVPIERVSPDEHLEGTAPEFWENEDDIFGKVVWGKDIIADLSGMSGSPVFAVKIVDERLLTNLVGVECGWLRDRRIVRVISLKSIYQLIQADLDSKAAS